MFPERMSGHQPVEREREIHELEDDRPFVPEYERPTATKEELGGNYEGDWTLLLHDRFLHPKTKEKFFRLKKTFPTTEKDLSATDDSSNQVLDNKINIFKYTDIPPKEYEEMISEEKYDENLGKVFSSTRYVEAEEDGRWKYNLGSSKGRGDEGGVFIDAEKEGKPLTLRQKNIIESHEKTHGLAMGLTNGEKDFILSPFRERIFKKGKVLNYAHKAQADEILTRMTQLKNYFGFKGGEVFTRAHLVIARDNYVRDTGLDNNMSEFFDAINKENESDFLDRINTVAC